MVVSYHGNVTSLRNHPQLRLKPRCVKLGWVELSGTDLSWEEGVVADQKLTMVALPRHNLSILLAL